MNKSFHRRAWAGFAVLLVLMPGCPAERPDPAVEREREGIEAVRIEGTGAILDPAAGFWNEAPAFSVQLQPQVVVDPRLPEAAVGELEARAVHNGEWIGMRLRWADETRDDVLRTADFGDQVAVQFPIDPHGPLPSAMMGHEGAPVNVVQWRAPFQRDLDEGAPDIFDLYPYALVDIYPDEVLGVIDARAYTGALGVDNPISRPYESPVLDQIAEGWGSLTVKPIQLADGRGVWNDGEWTVVITRPLFPITPNDPDLRPGTATNAAFAVWEGGSGETGARKSWALWVPLRLTE